MARTPKPWAERAPNQRRRILGHFRKQGWTDAQTIAYVEGGGNLAAARGHAQTPEKPTQAVRHPARYQQYRARQGGKPMLVISVDGVREVDGLIGIERTTVSRHWHAVRAAIEENDWTDLDAFEGVTVNGVELSTNHDAIEMWALRREFDFDSIYPATK